MEGVGQLRWQYYRRHQPNPQPWPETGVLAEEEKKEESRPKGEESHQPRERNKRRGKIEEDSIRD